MRAAERGCVKDSELYEAATSKVQRSLKVRREYARGTPPEWCQMKSCFRQSLVLTSSPGMDERAVSHVGTDNSRIPDS